MANNNNDALNSYSRSIKHLKRESLAAGLSEDEFQKMYFETLQLHENMERVNQRRYYKKHVCLITVLLALLCIVYHCRSIYSYLICNLQEYIYPGLRLIRKISIPFISLFPALTELYQEPCLIQNPFFTVVDMDCWPCSTVNNIRQINDPQPVNQQHSAPFIYETDQNVVNMETLRTVYLKNKQIFDKEAQNILKNGKFYISPMKLFQDSSHKDNNNVYIWKFTNFYLARLLRQIISRPKVVPKFGQSTERFIIIDSSQSEFHVPDTECNYSFLLSLSGTRTIDLRPAEECKNQCKSLQVKLKESYLLWYNWWYWRPVVQVSNGNSTFIAHVGSYC